MKKVHHLQRHDSPIVGGNVWKDGTYNYIWGAELITNGSVYYVYNAHGDVIQLLDESGNLIKTYDYDAYGNELTRDQNDENPFRYCGEYYDTETGFIYLRARYYDPNTGRFISQDTHWNVGNMIYGDNPGENPLPDINAIKQSSNLYVYCMNNPLKYVDKDGEFAFLVATAIAGAIIGGIIGGVVSASKGEAWWKGALIGAGIGGAAGLVLGAGTSMLASTALGGGVSATLAWPEIQEGLSYIRQGGWAVTEWGYSKLKEINQGIQHFFNYAAEQPKRIESIAERLGLQGFEINEEGFKAFTNAARNIINNYDKLGGVMREIDSACGTKLAYYYNEVIVITFDGKIQSVMRGDWKSFWNVK